MIFAVVAMVNIFLNLFEWPTISNRIINYAGNLNPYVLAAILFLVFVIAVIILIFEFYRRKISMANISTDSSGKTMVTLKTSAAQISQSLNNVQGIMDPKVKVVPRQNGIIINIFSKLATGVNIADKTKEIREAASNFASQNLGFKVLQTNYTATGFVTKKVKEVKEIKEEPKYVMKEEQAENKVE
jgi:hypothetical protein